jgi:hypothetical protein
MTNELEKRDYMIEQTMARMTIIENVLEQSHSDWARQHWSQVLEYFRRQLMQQSNLRKVQ